MKPAVTTQKRNEWATTDDALPLNEDGSPDGIGDQLP
jgi:hypothetical protein